MENIQNNKPFDTNQERISNNDFWYEVRNAVLESDIIEIRNNIGRIIRDAEPYPNHKG